MVLSLEAHENAACRNIFTMILGVLVVVLKASGVFLRQGGSRILLICRRERKAAIVPGKGLK